MIVVDTSALVAIAKGEAEKPAMIAALAASRAVIGTPTLLEAGMVMPSYLGDLAASFLAGLLGDLAIAPTAFTAPMVDEAMRAFRLFGRGQGHPARLNFGDCMAYAVAKTHGAPLLFKGNDFIHTDIRPALAA